MAKLKLTIPHVPERTLEGSVDLEPAPIPPADVVYEVVGERMHETQAWSGDNTLELLEMCAVGQPLGSVKVIHRPFGRGEQDPKREYVVAGADINARGTNGHPTREVLVFPNSEFFVPVGNKLLLRRFR